MGIVGTETAAVVHREGRFRGELDIPDGMQLYPQPYISGDVVIAHFQDDAGTPMVKRYRLVSPQEEGEAR